jgi:hypothetical protein
VVARHTGPRERRGPHQTDVRSRHCSDGVAFA